MNSLSKNRQGRKRRLNAIRAVASAALAVGHTLWAAAPIALDDQASTSQDTPVVISVLTNDADADLNQLAILRVTTPAHGSVFLNSDPAVTLPELPPLFEFAATQLSNTVAQIGDTNRYPRYTQTNGLWVTRLPSIYNWVSGFFPGALWFAYEETGDARFRSWAESWMSGIAPLQYSNQVDDIGFMINTSFGNGYRLTGNPDWKAVVLQTAQSFSTRFNAAAGCLSTWGAVTNQPFDVFVDTMMNLEVLFRAFELGGDTNFYTFAYTHAETTMLNHVRPDGSTYHIVRYDGTSGEVLWRGTHAGASDESTWARGQAWAVYGFTMAYRETGDVRFLDTARRLADYCLTNLPSDGVPYWDYQAPGIPNEPRDSSAAAILCSGLLELSARATNAVNAARYWQAARWIFDSLRSTNYLAEGSPSSGVLLHGVGETPPLSTAETDVSLIYGDYYFIEALKRQEERFACTRLTYVPEPGFAGTDTFSYQVCDSGGECSTATVTVIVEPAATNPWNVQLYLSESTRLPVIVFPTATGRVYHVEYEDAFPATGFWSVLASNIIGSGSAVSIDDTNPAPVRFYRAGFRPD